MKRSQKHLLSIKTVALAVVQVLISAVLLVAIVKLLDPAEIEKLFKSALPFWVALAFVILVVQQLLTAERWRLVALALSAPRHTFSFYMLWQGIGSLCSMVLPSIIGADLVRTYALSRRTVLSTVVRVILVDRALGLLALAVLTIVGCLTAPLFFMTHALMLVPVSIAVGGFIIYFALTRALRSVIMKNVIVSSARQVGADLKYAIERRGQIWCILTSLLIHTMSVCAFLVLGAAINVQGIQPLDYLKIVPSALLITVIPFSIGGWGLRESAVIIGFGLLGVGREQAFALSVMFGVLTMLAALVPSVLGLVWFFQKPKDYLIKALEHQSEQ